MKVTALDYTDFMSNPIVYDAMQMIWYDLLNEMAMLYDFTSKPYLNPLLPDGEKDGDANPIFNTYIKESNRGVRINRYPKVRSSLQGYKGT
ncbi:MAG: hypothetical protein AAGI23_01140 [Bacteroidota bacterium]